MAEQAVESPGLKDDDQLLVDSIRQDVLRRTNGTIRELEVSIHEGTVALAGRTSRYYYKQLATSAVLDVIRDLEFTNDIDVQSF